MIDDNTRMTHRHAVPVGVRRGHLHMRNLQIYPCSRLLMLRDIMQDRHQSTVVIIAAVAAVVAVYSNLYRGNSLMKQQHVLKHQNKSCLKNFFSKTCWKTFLQTKFKIFFFLNLKIF